MPALSAALVAVSLAAADPAAPTTAASPEAPATAPPSPAAPAPPSAAAVLRSAVAIEATQRLPLVPGAGEVVVDPGATFEIELSARVPDARLVLVDAREDLVPSSSSRELASGTRLTLSPAAPLVPGSRYALRLDGASRRDLHDEVGRAFSPLTLPILAAGSPPPPEPKKPVRRKRRR